MDPGGQVNEARQLLEKLVLASGHDRQDVDDELGYTRGYVSRLLSGKIKLTYRHILEVLAAIGADPHTFFLTLHPQRSRHRVDYSFLDALARSHQGSGLQGPLPEVPSLSPDDLKKTLIEALRDVLGERREPPPPPAEPRPPGRRRR